jgi:hypothetical protein
MNDLFVQFKQSELFNKYIAKDFFLLKSKKTHQKLTESIFILGNSMPGMLYSWKR